MRVCERSLDKTQTSCWSANFEILKPWRWRFLRPRWGHWYSARFIPTARQKRSIALSIYSQCLSNHRCVRSWPNRLPESLPQQLLRTKGGNGRVAATEILVGNHAVASIIREGKVERIVSVIQAGKREGMQLLDDALEKMVQEDIIDGNDAYMKSNEKRRFEKFANQ